MNIQRFLLLILSCFFLSNCTSKLIVLKPKCSALNWFEKGRQDGMQGQPSNNWTMKSADCETMDKKQITDYMDGWNHGLALYCTKDHGFSVAKSGIPYKRTCPENYEEDFLKGFEEGLKVYLIEKETAQIIAEVDGLETHLRTQSAEIAPLEKVKLEQNLANLTRKKADNLKILEKYNEALTR
ncbi:MAG: DUF2799 domain-containing protein [Bdellovibrionaceae bacterium]|nr:DUF2799 domain-containing protein [Pseudobdellovibrionaceae bacterium]